MHSFEVHSNERACRKIGHLGLEQVHMCLYWPYKTNNMVTPANQKPKSSPPWHHADIVCWWRGGASYVSKHRRLFHYLKQAGLDCGYFFELTKIVQIFHMDNLKAAILFGECHGFKFRRGAQYVGGFIGKESFKQEWMICRTVVWEEGWYDQQNCGQISIG